MSLSHSYLPSYYQIHQLHVWKNYVVELISKPKFNSRQHSDSGNASKVSYGKITPTICGRRRTETINVPTAVQVGASARAGGLRAVYDCCQLDTSTILRNYRMRFTTAVHFLSWNNFERISASWKW